ncbi:MAG: winged helix-turn-helix domain-containing protein [Actinomycetota bacterium]
MGIPTVLMVGMDRMSSVPEYLRLRSVVVLAPSKETLILWQQEGWGERSGPAEQSDGLRVDISGRRLAWQGSVVPLTDLEFRVAACLASEPGRAWSYRELRRTGWGNDPNLPMDVFAVRSVIQRIRGKLRAAGAAVRVESVRGFGFRLEVPESRSPSAIRVDAAERAD